MQTDLVTLTPTPLTRATRDPSLCPTIALGQLVASCLSSAAEHGCVCSFRQLAHDNFNGRAASSLWRALNTYRLAERYPELAAYTCVGVGHISVVLAEPENERITLLRQAERLRWSRRRLQAEIRERRQAAAAASECPS